MASILLPLFEDYHETLGTVLNHLQIVQYITVAALTFNIWDFVMTFPDEVKLVWRAPASWVKYLFLLNRYLGPSILIVNVSVLHDRSVTDAVCTNWFRLEGWGGLTVIVVVQVILMLRVTALYERNVTVVRFLVLLLLAEITTAAVILGVALPQIQPLRWLGPIFLGCVTPHLPQFFFSLFIPHWIVETTLFVMTVVQSIRNMPKGSINSTPMLLLLLRDGTLYFFAMFAATSVTAFTWLFASPSLMKVGVPPLIAISSVSGCRIILNLRHLRETNEKGPELNLSTLDLGDLELKTLPRTTFTQTTSQALRALSSRFSAQPPMPPLPEWSSRTGFVTLQDKDKLGDALSRRSTLTMVDDLKSDEQFIEELGLGYKRGKWMTFDDIPSPEDIVPTHNIIERGVPPRPPGAGAGGWQQEFLDIRPSSTQRPPAPALPPPPRAHARNASASPPSRLSVVSSSEEAGEQSPLSPSRLRQPPEDEVRIHRIGRIAPFRDLESNR